ncbi:MAG: outer membrane beta-barrel protein [Chitinophagaceae bacterium]|nr:outer membrane beta-barrel protein [Chitinophagaceae bacterium]
MHNLSDNELDRLGRDAAEQYNAPQGSASWDAISRRLDVEMPREKRKRRFFFWIILAAMLLSGGAVYYYFSGDEKTIATVQEDIKNKDEGVSATRGKTPVEHDGSDNAVAKLKEEKATADDETKNNITGGLNLPIKDERVNDKKENVAKGNFNPAVKKRTVNVYEKGDNKTGDKQEQNKNTQPDEGDIKILVKEEVQTNRASEETKKPVAPLSSGQNHAKAVNETDKPASDSNQLHADDSSLQQKVTEKNATKKIKANTKKIRPFEIGFVYAPDMSNVKFTHSDKTGYNIGFTLGYNFSRRWSVNTGVLWTKKNYTTTANNYKFPSGSWAYNPGVYMKSVKANCEMVDIPLNLRYNAIVGKKYSAFISAGISSYLMGKEDFHYYFMYNNNPSYRRWVNSNSKNYWFSTGNLSMGYEQQLTPAFSVQAEPFLKFSLRDVGSGNVRLNSMGMFIGVKYKPAIKNK